MAPNALSTEEIRAWLERTVVTGSVWFVKRLAAADTSALQAHQRGPSIPRDLILEIFSSLVRPGGKTSVDVSVSIASHDVTQSASANWYDLKTFGGLRRESRLVGWREKSVVTNPAAAGSLTAFVFRPGDPVLSMWLCRDLAEERVLTDLVGPAEAGWSVVWRPPREPIALETAGGDGAVETTDDAALNDPSAEQLVEAALKRCVGTIDERVLEVRKRVMRMIGRARIPASGGALFRRRAQLSTEAFRLQLQSQLGVTFELDDAGSSIKAINAGGSVTKLVAVTGLRGVSWPETVGSVSPGTNLLTLQDGLSQDACDALRAAGVTLVAPVERIQSYPVAARKNISTVDGLIRTLKGR